MTAALRRAKLCSDARHLFVSGYVDDLELFGMERRFGSELESGLDIPIEERDGVEVLGAWGLTESGAREYVRVANPGSPALNPGFDVTPADLITQIITPVGSFKPRDLLKNRSRLKADA